VTHSEFFIAMDSLGDRTAQQALDAGIAPKRVWLALCGVMHVPLGRQHGVGLSEPLGDTPG
jgi:hypothetical protein